MAAARDIDRMTELAHVGASHAATAFAQLVGLPIYPRVPEVRPFVPEDGPLPRGPQSGVFFELEGGFGAQVAILLERRYVEAVVRRLLGQPDGPIDAEAIKSVLAELGNILASHVANAIADTGGDRILPSVPRLALGSADRVLRESAAERNRGHRICIESLMQSPGGEVEARLVVVPDQVPV